MKKETKVVHDTPEDYVCDRLIKAKSDKSLLNIFLQASKKANGPACYLFPSSSENAAHGCEPMRGASSGAEE